jgi:ankyrin repeat protein
MFSQAGGWERYTPLGYAAIYNQFEVVNFLLSRVPRLNIDKGDKFGRSPLIMACRNGNTRIVSLLLAYGADIEGQDTSANTALHHAAAYGWDECVRILIENGAELDPESSWKTTPV